MSHGWIPQYTPLAHMRDELRVLHAEVEDQDPMGMDVRCMQRGRIRPLGHFS